MMNSLGRVGSTPRSTRLSISACTTEAFSVAPSMSPSGCLMPSPSIPTAATSTRCSVICMPSICMTRRSSPERSASIKLFMRSLDNATKCRDAADFDVPDPAGAGISPSGSRTDRRNFRVETLDEHQIHRPLSEPVLPHCLLPARQRDLLAAELTNPRPFDVDLAPMEANLPLRVPPAIPAPALSTRVARPAKFLSLLLHHRRKRLEASRQAEPLEAGRYLIPSLTHSPRIYRRQGSLCCATSLHGVAFLCGIKHPEPTGSRRATPLLLFQHSPGQFLEGSEHEKGPPAGSPLRELMSGLCS